MGDDLNTYRATTITGHFVAGRRVPWIATAAAVRDESGEVVTPAVQGPDPDWRVELTERQARYEIANGTLIECDTPAPSGADQALNSRVKAVRVPSAGVTSGKDGKAA